MRVKVLLVAEMEIDDGSVEGLAQAELDGFREAVRPEAEYGITLYRPQPEELTETVLAGKVEVIEVDER